MIKIPGDTIGIYREWCITHPKSKQKLFFRLRKFGSGFELESRVSMAGWTDYTYPNLLPDRKHYMSTIIKLSRDFIESKNKIT
ncbi:hypothetical protein UA38_12055 [Photobacterium kishitanii]|uniref:Uncharacterized protein n=1 Tax=Photobacterium kishitanii TaxID=318456 RepID=A0AAX0YSG9_9GAMM|nr:hypothetical protein UA38_12055 [Photobacterium kishitanii]KJG60625.1 hypothetical protein UA42_14855 [Photobacterium kishitanii]KJG64928.1 hypothetical protein UA40_14555 [Photobacterium kishitanii]KJG66171.1 hypothetical protein UA41_21230 [Photobacterium kishitanii]PSX18280.1 hypothetical protein C0W70_15525 [Photobacterium kishitanii]